MRLCLVLNILIHTEDDKSFLLLIYAFLLFKCCCNLLEDQCTTNGDSAPVNGEGQPRQLDDSMEDIMSKIEAEQPPDYQVSLSTQ